MVTQDEIYSTIISFVEENHDYNKWTARTDPKYGVGIYFFKSLVATIKFSKSNNIFYVSIPCEYNTHFSESALTQLKPVKDFIRFPIYDIQSIYQLKECFMSLYSLLESEYRDDDFFGCCHLYEQCSDAKHCLQENVVFSNRCWYKSHLINGRIFYGVNTNVNGGIYQ